MQPVGPAPDNFVVNREDCLGGRRGGRHNGNQASWQRAQAKQPATAGVGSHAVSTIIMMMALICCRCTFCMRMPPRIRMRMGRRGLSMHMGAEARFRQTMRGARAVSEGQGR